MSMGDNLFQFQQVMTLQLVNNRVFTTKPSGIVPNMNSKLRPWAIKLGCYPLLKQLLL